MIWTHGSTGLSLDDIAKELKLSKTSLYSVFGNKNGLLYLCLELYEKQYEQPMLASFSGDKISDCVGNFLDFASDRFNSSDSPPGCFMFNCAIEGEAFPAEFKVKVEQYNIAFREVLKQRVVERISATDPDYVDSMVDMLLVNLFGLASASRMKFPLRRPNFALLDKFIKA